VVETRRSRETHEDHRALLQAETNSLWNRIRLVDWSFRSLVAGALIVCLVIMALFLSELSHLNFSSVIAFLFVASMCLVIIGLVLFLFEVSLSTTSIREGIDSMIKEELDHSLETGDD
jgi:amino acid permease